MAAAAGAAVALAAWVLRPPSTASVQWGSPQGGSTSTLLAVGTSAPPLRLATAQGDTLSPHDNREDRLALVFVRPGCPHCERLLRHLGELDLRADQRLVVICGGDAPEAERMQAEHDLTFPVLVDAGGTAVRAYQVSGVPAAYLLDEGHTVTAAIQGMPATWELLEKW
ncbi:MAG: TlpA disulfide reductase family protein [Candidatus Latescibacterota bacterium]